MIRSMTAFARLDREGDWGQLTCELRSVNHRYLETHFRLPDNLRDLEPSLREAIRQALGRGKVELSLRFQPPSGAEQAFNINMETAQALNEAANHINRLLDNPAHLNALEFLQWPGVLEPREPALEPVREAAGELVRDALVQLSEARAAEGARLKALLEERLDGIGRIAADLRKRMPELMSRQQENLQAKLRELQAQVDEERLAQEVAMIAQRADVAEELDRLETHVAEVRACLEREEPVGRRLDFMMQELNREANTLGSKSIDTGFTQAAVDLKVLIEQMREQVQNVE